jgi:hypothetical protein
MSPLINKSTDEWNFEVQEACETGQVSCTSLRPRATWRAAAPTRSLNAASNCACGGFTRSLPRHTAACGGRKTPGSIHGLWPYTFSLKRLPLTDALTAGIK